MANQQSNEYEIKKNMAKAGISAEYRSKNVKPDTFPLVEDIRTDIKNEVVKQTTPILFVLNDLNALPCVQMTARYFVYPRQRSTYCGGFIEFMDFLTSDEPHLATSFDVEGFARAKHVFIDSFLIDKADKAFPLSRPEQFRMEQYIIRGHYQAYRRFHLALPCMPDDAVGLSTEFRDFLKNNYKIYQYGNK